MRLEGKVALISGAARGMGAEEARIFAREGASVVIGDISEEDGQAVEAQISEAGGQALFVRLDVTQENDWTRAVDLAVSRYGKLDILVNNAGISSRSFTDDTSIDGWDRIMEVNSKGVFLGTRAAVPKMLEAGGGSIINISSIMGLVGSAGGHPAYNASKGAVRIFSKAMAVRHGKDNIRVNSVHPGFMPPMTSGIAYDQDQRRQSLDQTPMGREGRIEEVANAVLFLASDEASYITGAELAVDGGFTAK
ncbi:MAG: glucose 1-dehydrogenase [Chloroflexi bacterium]|nr:glucose 1-dehydrogenase [Chloroflexota bacterium]MCH8894602.1 glucose 1-dehydrogenase [Chloroflexota bacterium]MCI0811880.1 glucose 1-dehydrogenase [Chloroflexota bacterium]MCI0864270.1 glucose 1-dehydrogenase [Chloroflexota bacterium]